VLCCVPQEALCTCYNIGEWPWKIVREGPVLAEMVRARRPDFVSEMSGKSEMFDMYRVITEQYSTWALSELAIIVHKTEMQISWSLSVSARDLDI
jgi:hypothetical protein